MQASLAALLLLPMVRTQDCPLHRQLEPPPSLGHPGPLCELERGPILQILSRLEQKLLHNLHICDDGAVGGNL